MPQRLGILGFIRIIAAAILTAQCSIAHLQTSGFSYLSLHIMAQCLLQNSAAIGTKLRLQTGCFFTRSMTYRLLILQSYLVTIQAAVFRHTLAAAGSVHHLSAVVPL